MNNNSGLTLLETLISLLVLSLGILGLAPLIILSIDSNNMSQDVMTVSNMAKERLETYSDPDNIPVVLPYKVIEESLEDTYNCVTYIWDNSTDSTIADGLANIRVAIAWIDKTGNTRLSEYTSIIQKE